MKIAHVLVLNDNEFEVVRKAVINEAKRQQFRFNVGCCVGMLGAFALSEWIIGKLEQKMLETP